MFVWVFFGCFFYTIFFFICLAVLGRGGNADEERVKGDYIWRERERESEKEREDVRGLKK